MSNKRVDKVTDLLNEGDMILTKVLSIDNQGKVKLSRKEALREPEAANFEETLTGPKVKELV